MTTFGEAHVTITYIKIYIYELIAQIIFSKQFIAHANIENKFIFNSLEGLHPDLYQIFSISVLV
jgi:hypothetical protein